MLAARNELGTQSSNHCPVVGAETQRWDAQFDSFSLAALFGKLANAGVGGNPTTEEQPLYPAIATGSHRFRHENIRNGFSEARGDIFGWYRFSRVLSALNPASDRGFETRKRKVVPMLRHVFRQ